MNDEPIPLDHGYPLRIVVPGVAGARSCKWLLKIIVAEKESDSLWQTHHYKSFSPNVEPGEVDYSSAPAVQEMPVTSAITAPKKGDVVVVRDGKIEMNGRQQYNNFLQIFDYGYEVAQFSFRAHCVTILNHVSNFSCVAVQFSVDLKLESIQLVVR
jgi:hypothetical protein